MNKLPHPYKYLLSIFIHVNDRYFKKYGMQPIIPPDEYTIIAVVNGPNFSDKLREKAKVILHIKIANTPAILNRLIIFLICIVIKGE